MDCLSERPQTVTGLLPTFHNKKGVEGKEGSVGWSLLVMGKIWGHFMAISHDFLIIILEVTSFVKTGHGIRHLTSGI